MVLVPRVLNRLPVLLVLTVLRASAQDAPARNGAIAGQVVDAATGRPVSAAMVSIAGTGLTVNPIDGPRGQRVPLLTASDGRFVFTGLADGTYTITAAKGGYAQGASGRRRPGGASQAVVIDATQRTRDVQIRVWKNGAIGGTVIDEAGEPVIGVSVRLLARASGSRRFEVYGAAAQTDDRGAYRFSNLPLGDYLVVALAPSMSLKTSVFENVASSGRATSEVAAAFVGGSMLALELGDAAFALPRDAAVPPPPVNGRLQIYPPTFHPAAPTAAQAAVISLPSGEERTSIDIQLSPVPSSRVSGFVIDANGPADMLPVRLVPAGSTDVPGDLVAAGAVTDATGAFVFLGVVPGQYSLRASNNLNRAGPQSGWLDLPLTVNGDVEGIAATLSPPLRIRVRLQFEGSSIPPAAVSDRFTAPPFSLEPAAGGPAVSGSSASAADHAVTFSGYPPGRYRVRVANSPQGWMFKGAMLNGVDVSEIPFELTKDVDDLVLTFTDRWSGLSGAVQGAGAEEAAVIVFTTDTQMWTAAGPSSRRFKMARPSSSGEFSVSSLPPGEYYAVAVREEDAADWRDPALLDALARVAARVTIIEGEHRTVDLPMREVRK